MPLCDASCVALRFPFGGPTRVTAWEPTDAPSFPRVGALLSAPTLRFFVGRVGEGLRSRADDVEVVRDDTFFSDPSRNQNALC